MTVTNISELNDWLDAKTVVALGSFDALHKGHVEVVLAAVEYARKNGLVSVVQLVDIPNRQKINSSKKQYEILEQLGVDVVLNQNFSESFRTTRYDEFISEYIAKKYNATAVFVGENYRFGYMAEGDTNSLVEGCKALGICAFVKKCLKLDKIISSTEIRKFITDGEMERAIEYMGRPFALLGKVIHGKALGRTLGFPTANIDIPKGFVVPKQGVYATKIKVCNKNYEGITNVGTRPTLGEEMPNIESFIMNFDGDLYGKDIEVEFYKRLRDIREFESLEDLKGQLEKDKNSACEYFMIRKVCN